MTIRPYTPSDKARCIEIFNSNCPAFFDKDELDPFIFWLDHQAEGEATYSNSEKDYYYVIEIPEEGVIGCGGFYLVKNENRAQLAWGMIDVNYHKQGYGTSLYKYRQEKIFELKPNGDITLGTSQFSYPFFEKMGLKVTNFVEFGYGESIHRYDMQKK